MFATRNAGAYAGGFGGEHGGGDEAYDSDGADADADAADNAVGGAYDGTDAGEFLGAHPGSSLPPPASLPPPPPPPAEPSLSTLWRQRVEKNTISAEDAARMRGYVMYALSQRSGAPVPVPVPLHYPESVDLIACSEKERESSRCLSCVDRMRCYRAKFHLVRYSKSYYVAQWAEQQLLDIDIGIVNVPVESRGWLPSLLGGGGFTIGGGAATTTARYVLQATRSLARCPVSLSPDAGARGTPFGAQSPGAQSSPGAQPPGARPANSENVDPCVPAPAPAPGEGPRLGDRWRDAQLSLNNEEFTRDRADVRRHVSARLSEGLVGPCQLFRLGCDDSTLCEDDAGYGGGGGGGTLAYSEYSERRRDDSRCALCRQNAILLGGTHIFPFTRAHLMIDWLIAHERLDVAIEYVPPAPGSLLPDGQVFHRRPLDTADRVLGTSAPSYYVLIVAYRTRNSDDGDGNGAGDGDGGNYTEEGGD